MIGRVFLTVFILVGISISNLQANKLLIVPANVNYYNEDIQYVSQSIYDFLNTSVVQFNDKYSENMDKKIQLKELVIPNKLYSKKIKKFHKKSKDKDFLKKIQKKYGVDRLLWFNFHRDVFTQNRNNPINRKIKLKICSYESKIECKKIMLGFDNKTFTFSNKSISKLIKRTKDLLENE